MQCMTPFNKFDKQTGTTKPCPCGKCPACIARRASGWSFRLLQEEKRSDTAYFITLTYDTKYVPITEKGFMGLCKRDIQLFFKKLRKAHFQTYGYNIPIKYFAVGEYGGRTMRPHYHVLLFNAKLTVMLNQVDLKSLVYFKFDGKVPVQCKQWDNGHITVGLVTGASVGYSLKYMCKPGKIPLHKNDDRQKEFALMSKGLGAQYLTKAMKAWHNADIEKRLYCVLEDGKKISMPRYYRERVYEKNQLKYAVEQLRLKLEKENDKMMLSKPSGFFTERNENIKGAFNRMKIKSTKNDKL